jgi:hypothetical protein
MRSLSKQDPRLSLTFFLNVQCRSCCTQPTGIRLVEYQWIVSSQKDWWKYRTKLYNQSVEGKQFGLALNKTIKSKSILP